MTTMDPPAGLGEREGWAAWRGWAAEDERWRAERTTAIAAEALPCTTCGWMIPAGRPYWRDQWRAPVLGRRVASAICVHCAAAGL